MQDMLDTLDTAAVELILMAKKLGLTYIITNAAEGWVEMSSSRFLPKVHEAIINDVTIISARTQFEK
jgi:hypothetical protein